MDTTKEYAAMIFELPEEFWKDIAKTKSFLEPTGQFCKNCGKYVRDIRVDCCDKMNRVNAIRQDQLQEMVKDIFDYSHPSKEFRVIASFSEEISFCRSYEIIWIQFVMKEKYGKVWNGTDWKEEQEEGQIIA